MRNPRKTNETKPIDLPRKNPFGTYWKKTFQNPIRQIFAIVRIPKSKDRPVMPTTTHTDGINRQINRTTRTGHPEIFSDPKDWITTIDMTDQHDTNTNIMEIFFCDTPDGHELKTRKDKSREGF